MKYLYLLLFTFILGCEQVDPAPELRDEVYKDLLIELDLASKSLEAEQKALEKLIEEKNKAVPQTGQIKFANKKIYDAQSKIDSIQQQKQYFMIKLEQRKSIDRINYLDNKKAGKPWPDPKEMEEYKSTMKLYRDKLIWDKKNVPHGTNSDQKTQTQPAQH